MAIIKEKYEISKCLYRSNNSTVFSAVDTATNDRVVLKTSTELMDLSSLFKLQTEYKIISEIKSEFVIKPIDFTKIGDNFYIVMEYCNGTTLSEYEKEHKFSIKEFLYVARKITRGLSDIHKKGIIHKDINPSNIMYDPITRTITIIDFGLATEFSYEKPQELNPTSLEGTLFYISPEQTGRMNRPIDFRTDYYSLGITFFEMLCGIRPFESESPMELIYSHIAKTPPTAKAVKLEVPDVLSKIFSKLVSKMPEDRYLNADGILFDINLCLEKLSLNGDIAEFELGEGDYSDRFEIKKELYGREAEISCLMSAFNDCVNTGKALIAIGGYPGVGKTSLVHELQKPVINATGFFISGKFDQYQRNVPYYALLQAIDQFCGYILSEPESRMSMWKKRLIKAFEREGKLLTNKIPRLKLLVGELAEFPEYSAIEEQIHFKSVLQRFIMAIASPKHPLVIFIDDIQLADLSTLEFIEDIMYNDKIFGLLLISCYRDNEVTEDHPLIQSLKKIGNNGVNVREMRLNGLECNSVALMIADALHRGVNEVAELTETVYKKTNGNPFYIIEFLKANNLNKTIYFNAESKTWDWDMAAIRKSPAEENVVDFLIRKIASFPGNTNKLLSFGACIGRSFSIEALSYISGFSRDVILAGLKPAVSEQLVYPIQAGKGTVDELRFIFSHDRFEQACYTMLSEEIRSYTHYSIAVYFEKIRKADNPEELLYIAGNYCKSLDSIDSAAEKRRVADFLFNAALTANKLSVYDTAERILRQIITSLPESFEEDAGFKYIVYSEYHKVLFDLARFDDADGIYELVEQLTDNPVTLADSCCLQSVSLSNRGRYQEAFMLSVALLHRLGVHFPENGLAEHVSTEIDRVIAEQKSKGFIGIDAVKETTDPTECAISSILTRIMPAAMFFDPMSSYWTISTNVARVLGHGYTRTGLYLYFYLFLPLMVMKNDYMTGYNAALKVMRICEQQNYKKELYGIYLGLALLLVHWHEDISNIIPYARKSITGNIEYGNFEYACFNYFSTQVAILETCDNIEMLKSETDAAMSFATKNRNKHASDCFISIRQFIKAVKGETIPVGSFNDDEFDEQRHLEDVKSNGMALNYFFIMRALSATLFSDFDTAFDMVEKAEPHTEIIVGHYLISLKLLIHSLALCKRIESRNFNEKDNPEIFNKLELLHEFHHQRTTDAPVNFLHLYNIIEAESVANEQISMEAVSLYERAINQSKLNNRPYHHALICELAAMRFLKLAAPKAAAMYLKEAYLAYLSWGAKGKVEQMRQKYQDLLSSDFVDSNPGATITRTYTTNIVSTASYDLDSVIKAAQAISGEMQLDAILKKLIDILLEIAGAQNIYYLEKKGENYVIQAEGHSEGNEIKIMQSRPISSDCVSMKVVNYVDRTGESVILDNAANSEKYGNDPYVIVSKCKSVMCLPVMNKGELTGILYFENNLAEGTFDKQRTNLLKAIASQLAISLENAYLYTNLKELVDERTLKLREEITIRKKAEKKLEDMANHDHLTNLPNRRMFQEILTHSIEITKLNKRTLGILFVDLDGFKAINDRYGHDKGDLVLVTVSERLLNSVRSCDTVSRMGGDEFVLIIENLEDTAEIQIICNRIISSIGKEIVLDNKDLKASVTCSIGVSILSDDSSTTEDLISNADQAMYIAKRNGKNQYVFYSINSDF